MSLFSSCCSLCRAAPEKPLGASSSQLPTSPLPQNAATLTSGGSAAAVSDGTPQLLPFTRARSSRKQTLGTSYNSDGGTGSHPGDTTRKRASVALLRGRTADGMGATKSLPMRRRDSQMAFANKSQTVVVFDWDDTLFPTSYISDDLRLDWQRPLERQPSLMPSAVADIRSKLSLCESTAEDVLRRANDISHVVIVTLASTGWVDMACKSFYPKMGQVLKELGTPIIYAQEKAGLKPADYDKAAFSSSEDIERFWGLVKGQAIAAEAEKFYSQYEGQSWKNILSIGDSSFERYGLLAATSAYMQGTSMKTTDIWSPSKEGCWQQEKSGHVKKLRAKCCKLVDQPDIEELTVQLEMIGRWLEDMVRLDDGFDLDLEVIEDESHVNVIESVLRGEIPASELPKLNGQVADPKASS